ncbi:MAG: ImmA/IrrE family metallo-endopeptidase [Clostridia bacterium]|nr:ImmA/IrrE family metallo-endopeptidase [Clostridia bacterium]
MDKIKRCVRELIDRYHSADPGTICDKAGIQVLDQDLPARVNGFTVTMMDITFIVLNSSLGYYERRFIMAHELGHIMLHKGTNSIALSTSTYFCVSKYEREADSFAAWLLMECEMSELSALESVTAEDISKIAHIPKSVAEQTFNI